MTRLRSLALPAVVACFLLAACGDADSDGPNSSSPNSSNPASVGDFSTPSVVTGGTTAAEEPGS